MDDEKLHKVEIKFTKDYTYSDTEDGMGLHYVFKKGDLIFRNVYDIMFSGNVVEIVFILDDIDCNHAILLDLIKNVAEVTYM